MGYGTFFEIGGHVIESYVDQEQYGPRPAANPLFEKAKEYGVPAPLVRQGAKETKQKTGVDPVVIGRATGRARRARRAFQIALALAAVDGPLPIGDALAIGVLTAYGAYEVVTAVGEVRGEFD